MDIIDQAMGIEQQGETLYRSFTRESTDAGAVRIFTWLADQEKKHYGYFQKMKEKGTAPVVESADLKGVREIFVHWKDTRVRLNVKDPQVELYRKALAVEKKSVELYEEAARAAADDAAKSALLRIAAEEKAHRQIMENIIEFVTKPEHWAENAEFGRRPKDYYL